MYRRLQAILLQLQQPCVQGWPTQIGRGEPNPASGVQPPDWQNWREPLARDWMDLDWSKPYRLAERLDADPPDTGLYKIWYEGQDSTLAYIGESSNISSRLYNHEQTFGEDALFAYAERGDLDISHKRKEIETNPIRTYYLKIGEAPITIWAYEDDPCEEIGRLSLKEARGQEVASQKSGVWYPNMGNFRNPRDSLNGDR